ncbi:MAG: amidophosphoribosyltransferase [Pseudomonadota bacterium]|jgi:amidophosphoribosyltransferase|nr:amidophosphoribosyltransferase [Hyphomicrobiales bacterium]MEC7890353.1 amidophosphoribosyltransferase [Pseudomonadota bacterium]|tara:strand:- start:9698 stop:11182 length:1485 start_codon:yes stop_codon:yes gene_type:complete
MKALKTNRKSPFIKDDKLHEECGVFGVYNHEDSAALTALGLHALQHRGQEAAGIVTFDGTKFISERHPGLVSDNFTKMSVINRLVGNSAVGHNRYSTTGATIQRNIQPFFADLWGGGFAIAHNGNITNALSLRDELIRKGSIFQSTSDTETILQLVARSDADRTLDRLVDALMQISGAWALVVLTNKKLIGARDPFGIRPLVLGELDGAKILASETCALDIIGAKFVREIEPGEIIVITEDGEESIKPFPNARLRPCIFEYIYFSRPDSMLDGKSVYECRKSFGKNLAKECPANADIVVPVPDSGVPAALGYSEESKIPFELSIIRNHYVGRTFILPTQSNRQSSVKLKHNPDRGSIKGKSVVLVDDSVVRGTTSVKIVELMREAGASEIHMRIACPPIKYPDFYGIDTPETEQLLASNKSLDEMCKYIGADSLGFLSLDGLYKSMGYNKGRNNDSPEYTDHCFTGDYPTNLNDYKSEKIQEQLSLLSENESQN